MHSCILHMLLTLIELPLSLSPIKWEIFREWIISVLLFTQQNGKSTSSYTDCTTPNYALLTIVTVTWIISVSTNHHIGAQISFDWWQRRYCRWNSPKHKLQRAIFNQSQTGWHQFLEIAFSTFQKENCDYQTKAEINFTKEKLERNWWKITLCCIFFLIWICFGAGHWLLLINVKVT